MSTIPVKISYKNDLRRISIDKDTTYETLKDTISKLFRIPTQDVPHMEIQYKDDEGDMIVMCTDIELKEALFLVKESSTPALRLTLEINAGNGSGTISTNPPPKVETTVETPVESKTGEEPKPETSNEPEFPSPPKSESLCTRVKELIRTGKYEDLVKARQILLSEYQYSPEYYHCRARVESLLGNSQGSIECIKQAIQYGLTNIEQLLQDPHLLNIQNLEEFTSLISDLITGANVKTSNTTANNTNTTTPTPTPESKSIEKELEDFVVPPITQTTRQLQGWGNWVWNVTNQLFFGQNRYAAQLKSLEEMGWKDRNACLRALEESQGDISTAVLILIDSEAK
jgi:hypothetical protein